MHRIGIIGPTKFELSEKEKKICENIAKDMSKRCEIVISPDKKSTVEFFTQTYKKEGGKKVIGIDYDDDTEQGYVGLDRDICNQLINCETWENQPKELIKNSDHVLVLGLSIGVTWELCLTKFYWYQQPQKRIFIIKELVKEKLPSYMNKNLNIDYISYKELLKII